MTKDEINYTKNWWLSCLSNPEKLKLWLQKLQRTELGGYTDHMEFMSKYHVGDRETKILTNIANDEFRHSQLLIDMMLDRGIEVVKEGPTSSYWELILNQVVTTKDYCAANYYGEALAAERFEIILSMEETPSDIRYIIGKALPDEIFHRETLMRLAGDEALEKFKVYHDLGLKNLLK